ncbi:MAG: alcohol dehydrogenase catalytic domain-containing protein, partial [Smithellaceae bacterium]|nr:alcohol dehydrogenase catalytic domain-containing protein [Smithellaceae bacterium]
MKAMVLRGVEDLRANTTPLELADLREPAPGPGEILVKVSACGICHTELDEIEGRTPPPVYPIVLGHQIVGTVAALGKEVSRFRVGDRIGIGWIYWTCGRCPACLAGNENLCRQFRATGRDADGGYAEFMTVSENFVYSVPEVFTDVEAAPLLCAGAIGYRSLRLADIQDGH